MSARANAARRAASRRRPAHPSGVSASGRRAGGPEPAGLVALARAVAAGNRGALEHLVRALYPVVRHWLGARLRHRSAEDLADLTQTAVALVAERVAQCDARDDRQLRAWARAVAWRVALEDVRSRAAWIVRHSQPLPEGGGDLPARQADAFGLVTADEPDDDTTTLARAAVQALDRMPPAVGLLFWMRLVEGASWPEIARAVGTTTAGVKRRFERARARLRRLLATVDHGGDT